MPVLNKEQALKVERRKFRDLDVPELGGALRIANVSAGCGLRLKELTAEATLEGREVDQRAMTLAMFASSIVDEGGRPLFDEREAEQFVDRISAETLGAIVSAITALSRTGKANGAEAAEAGPPQAQSESSIRSAKPESSPTA